VLEVNILPGPPDPPRPPAPQQRHDAARAELDAAFHHPRLRIVPDVRAGKADGVRLFSLSRTGPVLEAAGFMSADLVRGINGRPVTTPANFVEAFDAAVKTNRIEFSLLRMGQPTTLVVDVR
jgi:type II secretory pathway component PulC